MILLLALAAADGRRAARAGHRGQVLKWRVHALVEGYSALLRQNDTVRFYGVGATLGAVWAF